MRPKKSGFRHFCSPYSVSIHRVALFPQILSDRTDPQPPQITSTIPRISRHFLKCKYSSGQFFSITQVHKPLPRQQWAYHCCQSLFLCPSDDFSHPRSCFTKCQPLDYRKINQICALNVLLLFRQKHVTSQNISVDLYPAEQGNYLLICTLKISAIKKKKDSTECSRSLFYHFPQ